MPGLVLDPGALATRLQLQGAEDAPDGQGGASRTWTTVAAVWGRVEPVSASARELAGQAGQVVTHRVHLRARPGIAVGMRSRQAGKNVRDQGDARPGRIGTLSRLPLRGGRAMKIAVSVKLPDLARLVRDVARQAESAAPGPPVRPTVSAAARQALAGEPLPPATGVPADGAATDRRRLP